jgi:hypothetical protein
MQGESDGIAKIPADSYAKSLARLKRRVEEDFNEGKHLPMTFGQVLPLFPSNDLFAFQKEVRQSMANAHMKSGHAEAIPGCWMVETERMPMLPDRVHFNGNGLLVMGEQMAEGLIKAGLSK